MTVGAFLADATAMLSTSGIGTARLDMLVLLEDCLNKDRAHLLAHPELELTNAQVSSLNRKIKRRALHEPLAYIRGKTEFYGRVFSVNKHVLEPRPESETMIDVLKKLVQADAKLQTQELKIADVGSGSGCLGITAALELGLEGIDFYDIDPSTLQVARANADKLGIRGQFYESNLLAAAGPYEIILANLPYVPAAFHINEAAMREPSIAIFGGVDGLDLYRTMFAQLAEKEWKPKYILTEALPPQHEQLRAVATSRGFSELTSEDFIQVFCLPRPA
jgi:release factor glutamine methyltransferase